MFEYWTDPDFGLRMRRIDYPTQHHDPGDEDDSATNPAADLMRDMRPPVLDTAWAGVVERDVNMRRR